VSNESMVHYRGSRYSVPPLYAGKIVAVGKRPATLLITHNFPI